MTENYNFRCPRTVNGTENCIKIDEIPKTMLIAALNNAECLLDTLASTDRNVCPTQCPVKALIQVK